MDTGAIYILNYSTPKSPTLTPLTLTNIPNPSDFHPLGLAFDTSSSTLYAINHARSGSVLESFAIDLPSSTAKRVGTLQHELLHAPNAIHLLGNGKMLVTNDHYIRAAVSPLLSKIETFTAAPGGSVVYIDINNLARIKVVARLPFANGIAQVNESTVVVASSSRPGLYFYNLNSDTGDLTYKNFIRTPVGIDNLSLDGAGKLLIAGHPFVLALTKVAQGRFRCDEAGTQEEKEACKCDSASWFGEWSEEGGMKTLFVDNAEGGMGVCSSSTVVRDRGRGVGFMSMLYGKGVVVFRE